MKTASKFVSAIAVAAAALSAGQAFAREAGDVGVFTAEQITAAQTSQTTRADVRAEYLRAAAAGEVAFAGGDRAEAPAKPVTTASSTTRDQVRAEYFRAVRSGDIVQSGDVGFKLNEMYPAQYRGGVDSDRLADQAAPAARG